MVLILILKSLYTLLVLEFDILLRTFISIFFVATRHARCAILHHHVHETCHLQQGSVKVSGRVSNLQDCTKQTVLQGIFCALRV